ncbi:MAG: hypothetical protein SF066_12870 [Thermoanaerobaculia bacterium]|nr:hypothetical protein [Thermoanaerobaculia bacterium]
MFFALVLFVLFTLLACAGLGAALWVHRGPRVAIASALALLLFFLGLGYALFRLLAQAPELP